jgi:sugar lactone lactonase YvrE
MAKTGQATVVADDFDKPNGLAFSPDDKKLYIILPMVAARTCCEPP